MNRGKAFERKVGALLGGRRILRADVHGEDRGDVIDLPTDALFIECKSRSNSTPHTVWEKAKKSCKPGQHPVVFFGKVNSPRLLVCFEWEDLTVVSRLLEQCRAAGLEDDDAR